MLIGFPALPSPLDNNELVNLSVLRWRGCIFNNLSKWVLAKELDCQSISIFLVAPFNHVYRLLG